ncbi:MAG: type II secretion system protein [Eubacteriales bacterium]|nr:type II secretion system protein [Eubacteriales bacterium]
MKKLENNKGYTLTELLCALVILIKAPKETPTVTDDQ